MTIQSVDDPACHGTLDDEYHLKSPMRYAADHKQQTRERIVRAAACRFRTRGSEGAGIGDLMRDLRLTHGGFYRHFDSKEAVCGSIRAQP
jgi:TetR/AcrR family transcriptional regulator, transcriptional repressor for nem operon